MPIVLTGVTALILTFWTRKLVAVVLNGRFGGRRSLIAANVVSLGMWACLAMLVRTSDLEAVNSLAWLPYLPAQLIWLALDIAATRRPGSQGRI